MYKHLGSNRSFHSTSSNSQGEPQKPKGNRPEKDGDDDKDKLGTLFAKACLWMLTAYMFVAIIALMFPNTNQPEVINMSELVSSYVM